MWTIQTTVSNHRKNSLFFLQTYCVKDCPKKYNNKVNMYPPLITVLPDRSLKIHPQLIISMPWTIHQILKLHLVKYKVNQALMIQLRHMPISMVLVSRHRNKILQKALSKECNGFLTWAKMQNDGNASLS